MRMAVIASLLLMGSLAFLPAGPAAAAGNAEAEKAGVASAEAWLALVDAGKYDDSWTSAASLFKSAMPQAGWKNAVSGVRDPLGKLVSRKLKSKSYSEKAPGAPDGKYVVIQYDAVYANKSESVETVTSMLDKDGTWRIAGYFIR